MPKTMQQCEAIRTETKNKILQKSMLYFARNGFAGTKMSDLSRGIGIAQGTMYTYFESKEALYREVASRINNDAEVKQLALLAKMPIGAKRKIRQLTTSILTRLEAEESYAASIVLNTQLLLEENQDARGSGALYHSELYRHTASIVAQGQKEDIFVEGDAMKLVDYYWGVIYLYALKQLFTVDFSMLDAADIERTLLKTGEAI